MANLLFLVHRLPYPPDKGDKVRSYHLLKHLAAEHKVFLGTFVDDPADAVHLPMLRRLCEDVCAVPLAPRSAKLRSLTGLASGQPLTLCTTTTRVCATGFGRRWPAARSTAFWCFRHRWPSTPRQSGRCRR